MFQTNLKIACRNLYKRRFYTLLNVSGLVLAMICCLLIYVYTSYHLGFDNYHPKAVTTFKLVNELHLDKTEYEKGSSYGMFQAIKKSFPEVDASAFLIGKQSLVINVNGINQKKFREDDIAFTDAEWFNLFQYQWIAGAAKQLNEPLTAALTSKLARKYFGSENPIGQTLTINNQQITIIGLIDDKPYNTDLKSDLFLSFSSFKLLNPTIEDSFYTGWPYISSTNSSFFSLSDPTRKTAIEKELQTMARKHLGADFDNYYQFKLIPLKTIHFDLRYGGSVQKSRLLILATIGLLILVIASINYVNLVIAQQARRIVEIGTRKVLGGSAKQLFMQFMTESWLVSSFAILMALATGIAVMPLVNSWLFTDDPIYVHSVKNLLGFALILLLVISLGAGIYPSWILSRVSTFDALKNKVWINAGNTGRNSLVIIQNVIAQTLVVCTIVVVMQVNFLKNADQGFSREMVTMVPLGKISDSQKEQFSQALKLMPNISSYSFCHRSPSSNSQRGGTVLFDNRPDWETWPARFAIGDSAYCKTFGITIIAGRNIHSSKFKPEFLINETMAKKLQVKSNGDIIGKELSAGDEKGTIVGIVKDFNVKSLLEPIEPSVLLESNGLQSNLAIKLSGNQLSKTMNSLQREFNRILPNEVFSYQFVDDQIAALYKKESLQQKLIWGASSIAILISALGLSGMISLVTVHRTKEIGIRKVLGASKSAIATLISKDFLILVGMAFFIASPLSWWLMHQWLQGFAYRIELKAWMFAAAGGLTIVVALLTVSFQAIKAAVANPVKSLRSE
ncbi:MAG: ABC transporter permease [Sphingobacteriaceae bacterium]